MHREPGNPPIPDLTGNGRRSQMSGEDKVSSLRIRIARVRTAFGKKVNVVKLGLGFAAVALAAIGLCLAF